MHPPQLKIPSEDVERRASLTFGGLHGFACGNDGGGLLKAAWTLAKGCIWSQDRCLKTPDLLEVKYTIHGKGSTVQFSTYLDQPKITSVKQ